MSLITGCDQVSSEELFYGKALSYWQGIPATVNGMLGGYGHINHTDIHGSKDFLKEFIKPPHGKMKLNNALDCGAGIGRVAKHLLLPMFEHVDLAEVNKIFLDQAKTYLGEGGIRVQNYYCCGLQNLKLKEKSYDLIWLQWVTGHLTDEHFVNFLTECKTALRDNGLLVIKDNVAICEVELDDVDSSVTRNSDDLNIIYSSAGFKVVKEERQNNFPPELYNVLMTALVPR